MMSKNFATILEAAALEAPEKPFLLVGEKGIPYAFIENQAKRLANGLKNIGIQPGDHIGLLMPNIPQLIVSLAAIGKIGAVAIPFHPATPGSALSRLLQSSGAKAIIAFEAFLGVAQEGKNGASACEHLIIVKIPGSAIVASGLDIYSDMITGSSDAFETYAADGQEPAVILYTSGTTGQPKGVVHSHTSIITNITQASKNIWEIEAEDVNLLAASPSTIFAHTVIWGTALHQASMTMISKFDLKEFLQMIQDYKVTFFAGVPTIAHYMLHVPFVSQYDLSSLRGVFFGGASLPHSLFTAFEKKFNAKVCSGYGMTEGVPFSYVHSDELHSFPGTVGKPSPGVEMRIVDEKENEVAPGEAGEIIVKGPQLFTGYFNSPELNKKIFRGGWFHTGDIGRIDENGYIYLVDRLNNMIKRSGYKVFAAEVEQVLLQHASVAQAAVIGIPDEMIGEEIKAFVVLKPETSATDTELMEYCKSQMEAYKYPRMIEFRDDLPMTAAGKISHYSLREEGSGL